MLSSQTNLELLCRAIIAPELPVGFPLTAVRLIVLDFSLSIPAFFLLPTGVQPNSTL